MVVLAPLVNIKVLMVKKPIQTSHPRNRIKTKTIAEEILVVVEERPTNLNKNKKTIHQAFPTLTRMLKIGLHYHAMMIVNIKCFSLQKKIKSKVSVKLS
jgi:hypothetical protein